MADSESHAITQGSPPAGQWDWLTDRLTQLRRLAGDPSYSEIARRIAENRRADGLHEAASRVARTTVYDAFRTGRSRVNIDLVREIVRALGHPTGTVDAWLAESAAAAPTGSPLVPRPRTGEEGRPVHDASGDRPGHRPGDGEASLADRPPGTAPAADPRALARQALALAAACVVLNVLGRAFVNLTHAPLFLDMIGTAIAAVALGPWRGLAVGVSTNVLAAAHPALGGPDSVPFALAQAAGALVWGYGVRGWGGRSLPRFFALNLLAALAVSAVAVTVLLTLFGGSVGHAEDDIALSAAGVHVSLPVRVLVGNVLTSLADKTISGFLALVAVSMLPLALRHPLDRIIGVHAAAGAAGPGRDVQAG